MRSLDRSMKKTVVSAIRLIAAITIPLVASSEGLGVDKAKKTAWGTITPAASDVATFQAEIEKPPADNKLQLPTPFANITRAYRSDDRERRPLTLEFNKDASAITLHLGTEDSKQSSGGITLETAEKTTQFPNGRIVLSALDAKINGSKAQRETHLGNHRIGFWTNESDYVSWSYGATRPGTYDVELTYSGAGNDGTDIEVSVGETKLSGELKSTGSWYRYTTLSLGKLQIPSPGKVPVTVRCTKKTGGAVMNLKAITLRPACEGKPPIQGDDGIVVCHSRDVTIHGVKVRYEPQPKKNTVGFWANPKDFITWDFQIKKPGRFEIEVLQGCGKGHGGSEVIVTLVDQQSRFTVKDTGHFQNFVARKIGEIELDKPGWHQIEVRPVNKAKGAVMDIRQLRLIPIEAK